MSLQNGLKIDPAEFANGVDVGSERGQRMKNNTPFPVYRVHCCLPRWGKFWEKEILGRDHEFSFRGRKLQESLLAISADLTKAEPG